MRVCLSKWLVQGKSEFLSPSTMSYLRLMNFHTIFTSLKYCIDNFWIAQNDDQNDTIQPNSLERLLT